MTGWNRKTTTALLLALAVFGVFAHAGANGFIDYDDGVYIGGNPVVRNGLTPAGIRWAFTSVGYASNWHPATWISHMLDVTLFGTNPSFHHLTGACIHALSSALLFAILAGATGQTFPALAVAALFGLHPLRVESVAWAAERKDVLSVFFLVTAMGAYVRYVRRPSAGRYLAVLLPAALALLSKPTSVTLPLLLIALDVWPLGRWRSGWRDLARLLLEKVPLGVMTAPVMALTLRAQGSGEALRTIALVPLAKRIGDAAVGLSTYLWQTVWPLGLAVFYPRKDGGASVSSMLFGVMLLLAVTVAFGFSSRRRPAALAGWTFFLVALLPASGIVRFGLQAHADRYTYLPHAGLFMAIVYGLPGIPPRKACRRWVAVALVTLIAISGTLSWRQIGLWRDTRTLFEHTLAVTGENWMARFVLGNLALGQGRLDDAVAHLREAARLNAHNVGIQSNLAYALSRSGRHDEAVARLRRAISLDPGNPILAANLERLLDSSAAR